MTIALAGADGGIGEPGIDTTSDPLRFDEAWRWFEPRVPITKRQWLALDEQARRRAFTVAGVTALAVLDDVWQAIDRAIADGTSFADFQQQAQESLGRWNDAHLETVFRTNVGAAYQAGRWQQLTDPEVLEDRPYWQWVSVLDTHSSTICKPLEGVTKPASDSWWLSHYPPMHYQCRSTVISLTESQAHREGITLHTPVADPPLQGFGGVPNLSEWEPKSSDYNPTLFRAFQEWQARR